MVMSRVQRVQQWLFFARQWHLVDANSQNLDKLGNKVAHFLKGAHKPIFHPEVDCGDHVVVFNCRHVALKGFDWKHREYFFNRQYPKARNLLPAWKIHEYDPCRLMFAAVYKGLGNNLVRRRHIERLHLFADEHIPRLILDNVSNQLEQVQTVPKRSDQYSQDERRRFPALFDWDADHLTDWQRSPLKDLHPQSESADT